MASQATLLLLLLLGCCAPLLGAAQQAVNVTTTLVQSSVPGPSVRNAIVRVNPKTSTAFVGETKTIEVYGCNVQGLCPSLPPCPDNCLPATGVDVLLSGVGSLNVNTVTLLAGSSGFGSVQVTSSTAGESRLGISIVGAGANATTATVTWADVPVPPPPPPDASIGKVLLLPHKAVRHVHQPVTVTAVVLAPNRLPLSGVPVAFSMFGDCHPMPQLQPAVAVTDDQGWAATTVRSAAPGSVSVVATAQAPDGAVFQSGATHLEFVGGHGYEQQGSRADSYDGGDDDRHLTHSPH